MTRRKTHKIFADVHRHGWAQALHHLTLRTVNGAVPFKILRGVWAGRADPLFLNYHQRYTPAFLTEETVRRFAQDPESGMSEGFVDEALAKGDECFAILDGPALASYGWYSIQPTRIDPPELFLRFDREHVYMYKGFTHPRYRGQRLHAIGMTIALEHYLSEGYQGLVSYIESNNFDSLKSAYRMGYEPFGSVYIGKIFGRYFTCRSRGCERFDFRVEPMDFQPARRENIHGRPRYTEGHQP